MESIYHLPVGRAAEEPEFRMNGEELKQVLDFIRDTRKEGIIRASYGCEGFLVTMKVKYGILLSSVVPEYQSAPF